MTASAAFLVTCATAVRASPEYAAYVAALATLSAAGEDGKQAAFAAAYSDAQPGASPAYRVRRAVRDAIADAQTTQSVVLSQPESEAAYQALTAQLAPYAAPPPADDRSPSLTREDLDSIRAALAVFVDS